MNVAAPAPRRNPTNAIPTECQVAFNAAHEEVRKLMDSLHADVLELATCSRQHPQDWTITGDMARIRTQLRGLLGLEG